MKTFKILLATTLLFSFGPVAHAVSVEFRMSKMHGFYDFMETISGQPHHSEVILKTFKGSKYDTPEIEVLIKNVREAQESMPGINFNGFPHSRNAGADVSDLFDIQSIFSKDLNDFGNRTLGLLPMADHAHFFLAAQKLLPIYEKLIWNPSLPELKKYREKMIQIAKKVNVDLLFAQAVKFYGSDWPKAQPFVVSLYPTPGKGSTSSHSLGAAESVGVVTSDDNYEGVFGVAFHELCHSLYGAQPIEMQYRFEKLFLSQNSKYATHAYDLMNEALATALGNGIVEKKANGKLNSHDWYNNHYINKFSKAIYPLVDEYFSAGKTVDEDFAKKTIAILERDVPESLYDYENLFQWLVVLEDGKLVKSSVVRNSFRKAFRVSFWNSHDPMNSVDGLSDASSSKHLLLSVYEHSEIDQLDSLAEKLPFLKEHLKELKSKSENYIYSAIDSKGRAFVFIQITKAEDFQKALDVIKAAKRINLEKPFFDY